MGGVQVQTRTGTWGFGLVAIGLLVGLVGCADSSWEAARSADSLASYHRFLRVHPGSPSAARAKERIAYLSVVAHPTIEAYQAFEADHPSSDLLSDLKPLVEALYFENARDANSEQAYRNFLERFPNGSLTDRARGDLAYVEDFGVGASVEALRSFVARYPESDFVSDADHTLSLSNLRQKTAIRELAVRVHVAAGVKSPRRVRRGFASIVAKAYRKLGVSVELLEPGSELPNEAKAWMQIDYQEAPAEGTFGGHTMIVQCRVRLLHRDVDEPIWDRSFEAPAEHLAVLGTTKDPTIFGSSRYPFWDTFFVPVSTWATSLARVDQREYSEPVVAVDVRGDRAAVLLTSGGFEYLDVSSVVEPRLIGRYRRHNDLTHWTGVRVLPKDRVVLFGQGGIEVVTVSRTRVTRLAVRGASEIGSIRDASFYGDGTLLLAGSEGVWALRLNDSAWQPHRLIEADYVGVAVEGSEVYLLGSDHLDVATPAQLMQHITGTTVALGDHFAATRLRRSSGELYVFGARSIVRFDLQTPASPIPVLKVEAEDLGRVSDLVADAHHLYLIGERGLQILDRSGKFVKDRIQLQADRNAVPRGRFLFLAGGHQLQILDLSPYREGEVAASQPASPAAGTLQRARALR